MIIKPPKNHQILKFTNQYMQNKYSESFRFYLSKTTNLILNEIKCPEEIQFNDNLIFDKKKEFLRRFYKKKEIKVRLKNYGEYYIKLKEFNFPCYENLDQRKIMYKRRKRKYKLEKNKETEKLLKKRKKINKDPRKKNMLKKLENPTLYLDEVNNESLFEKPMKLWQNQENHFELNLMDFDLYDDVHDIFNPVFSSEDELGDLNYLKEKNLKVFEKNKKFFGNDKVFFENENRYFFEGNSEIINGEQFNESSSSILTKISAFELIDESSIKKKNDLNLSTEKEILKILPNFYSDKNNFFTNLNNSNKLNFNKEKKPTIVVSSIIKKKKKKKKSLKLKGDKFLKKSMKKKGVNLSLKSSLKLNPEIVSIKIKKNIYKQILNFDDSKGSLKNKSNSKNTLAYFPDSPKILKSKLKKNLNNNRKTQKIINNTQKMADNYKLRKSQKEFLLKSKKSNTKKNVKKNKSARMKIFKIKKNAKKTILNNIIKNSQKTKNGTVDSYIKSLLQKNLKKNDKKKDKKNLQIKTSLLKELNILNKESTMSNSSEKNIFKTLKDSTKNWSKSKNQFIQSFKKLKRTQSNKDKLNLEKMAKKKICSKNFILTPETKKMFSVNIKKKNKKKFLDEYNYYQNKYEDKKKKKIEEKKKKIRKVL